jgi:hypothetical protein
LAHTKSTYFGIERSVCSMGEGGNHGQSMSATKSEQLL